MPRVPAPPTPPGHDDSWIGTFIAPQHGHVAYERKEDVVAIVATTENLTARSGLLTVDGITLTEGQPVLVWKQTTATQNGLYRASSGLWTRQSFLRIATPISIVVAKGSTYGKKAFVVTADDTVAQYGGGGGAAGAKSASNTNLTLSGNQTIDAISCVVDDPVLVFGQSNAAANGLYTVEASTWTRIESFGSDTKYKIYGVMSGTNFGQTFFMSAGNNALVRMGAFYL